MNDYIYIRTVYGVRSHTSYHCQNWTNRPQGLFFAKIGYPVVTR